jgi:hypothetical protein
MTGGLVEYVILKGKLLFTIKKNKLFFYSSLLKKTKLGLFLIVLELLK